MGLSIGHGIGIPFKKSGISWQTYWTPSNISGCKILGGDGNDITIYNQCIYFGGNSYISYPNTTARISGSMTIAAYFMGGTAGDYPGGVTRSTRVGGGAFDYGLHISKTGVVTFQIAVDATTRQTVTYQLPADYTTVWYHVMGVYLASTYLRIFVNGVQVAENTTSIAASQYTSTANVFTIGKLSDQFTYGCVLGAICDVKVYDAVKTHAEVIANDTTNIVFWDMMNSLANDSMVQATGGGGFLGYDYFRGRSYAITGQIGAYAGTASYIINQAKARHSLGYTKVVYLGATAWIPYTINGTSQYANIDPVFNASETITEIPYDSSAIIQDWGGIFEFANTVNLIAADKLGVLFRPDGTAIKQPYKRLCANIGNYYEVTTGANKILTIKITKKATTYSSINLFGLWGQSNMVGVAEVAPALELRGDLNTYVYTYAGIDDLNYTVNNNQYPEKTAQNGIELRLSHHLYSHAGVKNAFVKVARGSTGVAQNAGWRIRKAAENTGYYNHYNVFIEALDQMIYWIARDYNLKAELKAFIQFQGEQDAIAEATSLAYKTNITDWYNQIRTYFGDTTIKIFMVKIGETSHTYYNNVWTLQGEYITEQALAFGLDGRDYELKVDNLHHTAAAYDLMGVAMADLIIANL